MAKRVAQVPWGLVIHEYMRQGQGNMEGKEQNHFATMYEYQQRVIIIITLVI